MTEHVTAIDETTPTNDSARIYNDLERQARCLEKRPRRRPQALW
jgi:hypothetical protein